MLDAIRRSNPHSYEIAIGYATGATRVTHALPVFTPPLKFDVFKCSAEFFTSIGSLKNSLLVLSTKIKVFIAHN